MLEYIRGTLTEATPFKATVEIRGLGYSLLIPFNNYSKMPALGSEIQLYVSTVIREDSHKLFGFLARAERDLFETLIEISGIGPKTALALVGHMHASELQLAIAQSNIPLICKIPGIGKKTAERLVVEMRDKIQKATEGTLPSTLIEGIGGPKDLLTDALSALVNLGYNPLQAQKALRQATQKSDEEMGLAALITSALRCL